MIWAYTLNKLLAVSLTFTFKFVSNSKSYHSKSQHEYYDIVEIKLEKLIHNIIIPQVKMSEVIL